MDLPSLPLILTCRHPNSKPAGEPLGYTPLDLGKGDPELVLNPSAEVEDMQNVQDMVEERPGRIVKSWSLLARGTPGSTHLVDSVGIHSAFGVVVAEEPFAFAGVEPAKTWYEPGLGRTGAFAMSWFASDRAAVLRQKFLKMQHHAGQKTDGRRAGSSGLAGPLYRPYCRMSPPSFSFLISLVWLSDSTRGVRQKGEKSGKS